MPEGPQGLALVSDARWLRPRKEGQPNRGQPRPSVRRPGRPDEELLLSAGELVLVSGCVGRESSPDGRPCCLMNASPIAVWLEFAVAGQSEMATVAGPANGSDCSERQRLQ